ncbi:protein kinase (macronuclear) [Tetrahymena thermophila SB210]|uniref:Protein kinase n=1 Tax=Tetrahymena thermophila (strain SB210) TaxID=312017 RepID=Q22HJ2_TETTS|nr:protein kinase [Tetrahymena thermophila SB210]EAR84709.1 protein kinase [Tetrahymena thermophila SB210]|eukprot:XP_001032372.1 protein kinase [Tetrahymena thermophila SB210]
MQNKEVQKLSKEEIKDFLQSKQSQITSNQIQQSINFLSQYGYHVVQLIDSGSFGIVMKAIDSSNSKRYVAIKLIIVTNTEILKENIQEYQKCLLINHPNVIKNYQQLYDEENECFFIITEFCQKGNLFNFFKQNNIKKEEIVEICAQIIEGVLAIHDKNIIHSDLKPQNILINDDDKIKICDLGMSKQLLGSKSHTISKGGSLDYMSPEQIEGKISKQSDIYSVGCIICFLCNVNIFGLNMVNIKKGIFPPIQENCFKELVNLAFKMMSVEPKNRIQLQDSLDQLKQFQKINSHNQKGEIVVKQFQNGDRYEGEVKDGKMNGKGIYYYKEDNIRKKYEGQWVNDKKDGFGILEYKSGNKYEGYFKNDCFNGKGIYYYYKEGDNKMKYEGQWVNNQKDGFGILEYKSGNKYEGQFKNDDFNGKGIYYYKQGDNIKKYEGQWASNQKDGFGIMEYKNGNRYEGQFKNGEFNGKGIFYYKEDDIKKSYDGLWVNDKQEGFGILEYKNGTKYEGNFKNGKKNGKGIQLDQNGQKLNGEWIDDKFQTN